MKIQRLEVSGFRAFTRDYEFDLSSDVVLFTGANGRGKTSVFDAILWALTGSLSRLEVQGEDPPIISLYASQARVSLDLETDTGLVNLVRSKSRASPERLSVQVGEEEFSGEKAHTWILTELWPEAEAADDATDALSRALTRSVYLQQDRVRQFVEADSSRDRFQAVSELVGAGRIEELKKVLDTQRRSWKAETNQLRERVEKDRSELEEVRGQLEELGSREDEDLDELRIEWAGWWRRAQDLGVDRSPPDVEESKASSAIDSAVKTLNTVKRKLKRSKSTGAEIAETVESGVPKKELPSTDQLQERLSKAKKQEEEAKKALEAAREEVSERREEIIRTQETAQELASLAGLALRHIDGPCPVCQQSHSTEKTRQHLESLIAEAEEKGEDPPPKDSADIVQEALAEVERAEKTVTEIEDRLKEAKAQYRRREQEKKQAVDWLEEQGASIEKGESLSDAIRRTQIEIEDNISSLEDHIERGESLSLRLATVAQEARREELKQKFESLEGKSERRQTDIELRDATSELADSYVEELEDATLAVVERRLQGVGSLLQKIYSKVDPHPSFSLINLLTSFSQRRGRIDPLVTDPDSQEAVKKDPFMVMSSSQINVVALSIFLALNMGVPSVPLKTLMLDDPLQSLDDINLLGFVDLLRRTRTKRQMFLATHDSRLAGLFERKLRPVRAGQETRVYRFLDWSREGPEIESEVITQHEGPMRIPAA